MLILSQKSLLVIDYSTCFLRFKAKWDYGAKYWFSLICYILSGPTWCISPPVKILTFLQFRWLVLSKNAVYLFMVFHFFFWLFFFYFPADKMETFLKQFPEFPNAFMTGAPADIFVIEVADQVKYILIPKRCSFLFFLSAIHLVTSIVSASKIEGGACATTLSFRDKSSPRYSLVIVLFKMGNWPI